MPRTTGVAAALVLLVALLGGCGSTTGVPGTDGEPPGEVPSDTTTAVIQPAPVADAYLNRADPDSNYGTGTTVWCGWQGMPVAMRAILRFDLTRIPTTATVSKATLRLHVNDTWGQDTDRFSVHRVTNAWTETGATWTGMSANYNPTVIAARSLGPSAAGTYVRWDITKLVRSWVETPGRNFGCVVRGTEGVDGNRSVLLYFSSRETALAAQRPRLIVDYTP
jgi:hypothetical protein